MATPVTSMTTAPVGYIGYGSIFGYVIRSFSTNIRAHQQIYNGDPASNAVDQPVYHVGPLEVDGDVSWPLLTGGGSSSTHAILQAAVDRKYAGGIGTKMTLETGYVIAHFPPSTGHKGYSRYAEGCMINRLSLKGTAGERIEASANFIGLGLFETDSFEKTSYVDLDRVMTWDDVFLSFSEVKDNSELKDSALGGGSVSCLIKEFSVEINNNVTRANTYCYPSSYKGTNIAATALILGKRQVSGSLTFIGSSPAQKLAINNLTRKESGEQITMLLGGTFLHLRGIVYELQQIDLTSGIIYGRVSFTAHGAGQFQESIYV